MPLISYRNLAEFLSRFNTDRIIEKAPKNKHVYAFLLSEIFEKLKIFWKFLYVKHYCRRQILDQCTPLPTVLVLSFLFVSRHFKSGKWILFFDRYEMFIKRKGT